MQSNWQHSVPSIDPVHFMYIMFERDIWPAKLNKAKRYGPPSPIFFDTHPGAIELFYRSSEKDGNNFPYADYRFTNTLFLAQSFFYAGSGSVSNPDIAFNTVLY
jgi:hypothetical protein